MKKLMYLLAVIAMAICCTISIPESVSAADQWVWPVPSIGIGQNISTYFGSGGHEGIDIYGSLNTPIVASRAGTVCRVVHGDIPNVYLDAGNAVVINHGNGIYSHYAHLNSTAVSEGQPVNAGDVIGYMGSTGNSTGVHLHFALADNSYGGGGRINNNPGAVTYVSSINRDPRGYLDGAEGGYGTIRVWGWAIDDDTPNQAVTVHIYADGPAGKGRCIYTKIAANNSSPDIGGNHRFDVTFETDLTGQHTIYAHAINTQQGNNPLMSFTGGQPFTVNILKDETPPVISNVEISDVSWHGYTVTCDVSDDKALDRVEFATRALNTEQDDPDTAWETREKGTVSNGKATYRVNTSAHSGKMGCDYLTNIYAYDKSGNVAVMNENTCPIEDERPILKVHVPGFEDSATGDWQEVSEIPADFDTSRVEVQYMHTYTKTAPSSPGEGWVQSGEGTTTYVNDGGVYESDFEKATSATCVYVGSYYYHYCGASTGVNVEHYNDGVHTDYHVAGDVNSFYVSGGPWTDDNDPRYLAYKISWVSGQWAGGEATCAAGRSAIWYRRYQYQNKKAVTNYKWVKTSDWESVNDSSATSVEYRYRLKDTSQPVIEEVNVSAVTPNGYTLICRASDDTSIAKIVFTSWTELESEQNAVVQEIVPQKSGELYEAAATISISDHDNSRECFYNTKVQAYDAAGNVVDYTGNLGRVFIPTLVHSASKLNLPAGAKEIEASAFEGDSQLHEVILPEGLETIGSRAFANCSRITLISVPDSVKTIDDTAFAESPNVVLICSADSNAAAFARKNEIPYLTAER